MTGNFEYVLEYVVWWCVWCVRGGCMGVQVRYGSRALGELCKKCQCQQSDWEPFEDRRR